MNIVEAFEGLTTGDIFETSEPVIENVQMEVDASSIPQEPDYQANEQTQGIYILLPVPPRVLLTLPFESQTQDSRL